MSSMTGSLSPLGAPGPLGNPPPASSGEALNSVILDEARIRKLLHSDPPVDAAPVLSRWAAFLPLVLVLSIVPSTAALLLAERNDDLSNAGLRAITINASRSFWEAVVARSETLPKQPSPPFGAWITSLVMQIGLTDPWQVVSISAILGIAGFVAGTAVLAVLLGWPRSMLLSVLLISCHPQVLRWVHSDPGRAWTACFTSGFLATGLMARRAGTPFSLAGFGHLGTMGLAILSGGGALSIPLVLLSLLIVLWPGSSSASENSIGTETGHNAALDRWSFHSGKSLGLFGLLLPVFGLIAGGWWLILTEGFEATSTNLTTDLLRNGPASSVPSLLDCSAVIAGFGPVLVGWGVVGALQLLVELWNNSKSIQAFPVVLLLAVFLVLGAGDHLLVSARLTPVWNDLVLLPVVLLAGVGLDRTLQRNAHPIQLLAGGLTALISLASLDCRGFMIPRLAQVLLFFLILIVASWTMLRKPWLHGVNSKERLIPLRLTVTVSLAAHLVWMLSTTHGTSQESGRLAFFARKLHELPRVDRIIVSGEEGQLSPSLRLCLRAAHPAAAWSYRPYKTEQTAVVTDAENRLVDERLLMVTWTLRERAFFPETGGRVERTTLVEPTPYRKRKLSIQFVQPVQASE